MKPQNNLGLILNFLCLLICREYFIPMLSFCIIPDFVPIARFLAILPTTHKISVTLSTRTFLIQTNFNTHPAPLSLPLRGNHVILVKAAYQTAGKISSLDIRTFRGRSILFPHFSSTQPSSRTLRTSWTATLTYAPFSTPRSHNLNHILQWNSGWPIQVTSSFAQNALAQQKEKSNNTSLVTAGSIAGSLAKKVEAAVESTLTDLQQALTKFIGSTDTDDQHLSGLAALGTLQARDGESSKRAYMGAVSPWFFTHYGADSFNKNVRLRFLASGSVSHLRSLLVRLPCRPTSLCKTVGIPDWLPRPI
jgi:hypothetical protein